MLKHYIAIARPDHWFKNVFVVPGCALGLLFSGGSVSLDLVINVLIALASVCLAASANYTINEWLDAEFDRYHPVKNQRASVMGLVTARGVYLQWGLLALLACVSGFYVNYLFVAYLAMLLGMGVIYNVRPFRTKDRQYLDTLSESINNPLRFMLGWHAVTTDILPPSSILLAYWMGGAFLMAVKRYAEFRYLNDPETAGLYRRSFRFYTEQTLLLSAFFYALMAAFFTGVFLIKYRVEYIIAIPLLALLFVWYLLIGMRTNSVTQNPELLYQEKGLMALLVITFVAILALTFIDMPFLNVLVEPQKR